MPNEHEIKSHKILVKDIFSAMWFRIPEYQRPYIWSKDEVSELLDDLTFAMRDKPEQEYFLGSFVFQARKASATPGQEFDENDLLDGQQRMTTLLMLFAVMRDLATDAEAKSDCQSCIFQKGSTYKKIPERNRLVFAIREEVQAFVDEYVKTEQGTDRKAGLEKIAAKGPDKGLQNMARAIIVMRDYLNDRENDVQPEQLLQFLLNNVLFIYVATEDLDDAFRLFTILNNRGVPLRNSDILKSHNLGALKDDSEKVRYALLWEQAENDLGDNFDRFLNYLRTILVKEKARLNLLQEFEQKIYDPKERDKTTNQRKPALLRKGKDTFALVERYLGHHNRLFSGDNYDETGGSFAFDNLIKVMGTGLPSTDWVPPLLRYFERFQYAEILPFLIRLDNKFSADWIGQYAPTYRIDAMNEVIKIVEEAGAPAAVLKSTCFNFDADGLARSIAASVYGRRFTRYLLLKLDYLYHGHSHRMPIESLSVEHILPQNPEASSQWLPRFQPGTAGGMDGSPR